MDRQRFAIFASAALGFVLFALVVRPAVERGGFGELALVIAGVGAILLVERWLRAR